MVVAPAPSTGKAFRAVPVAALHGAALAALALLLAYGQKPIALLLNAFWLVGSLGALGLADRVWGGSARVALVREGFVSLVAVAALLPIAAPDRAPLRAPWAGNARVWSLAFAEPDQALAKVVPRPEEWTVNPIHLRIDLLDYYDGPAGFLVEVNGHQLGRLDPATSRSPSTDRMLFPVPATVVKDSPEVRIVLRPSAIDARLRVVGHPDPNSEPLRERNSAFFDGQSWRSDRLDGSGRTVVGAYRIWLLDDQVLTKPESNAR